MDTLLFQRYEPLDLLGRGGMGEVRRVRDVRSGQELALKTLRSDASGDLKLLFRQEYLTMKRLRHPLTVEVFDFGSDEAGAPYFTMEIVPGEDLSARIPCSSDELRNILGQAATVLGSIHDQGFVHGDMKPENLRLMPDGQLKLMDFGLMTHTGQSGGSIRGTFAYMAPEVARRSRVDQRADLYALGAVAYHLLVGRPPFVGENSHEVLKGHLSKQPVPPRELRPDCDPEIEGLVLALLAKDPQERPHSAREVLRALGLAVDEPERAQLLASPLIGRSAELEAIASAFDSARRSGRAHSLYVSGEGGVGKSRLVEEARFLAELDGFPSARGTARSGDAPYQPLRELLSELVGRALDRRPELDSLRPVLASLVPSLSDHRAEPLEPKQEQARLFDAVGDAVLAAAESGLLLVLDDWQWADPKSTELVDYLRRRAQDHPMLFVFGTRVPPEGQDRLDIAPLDRVTTAEMCSAMLGSPPPDQVLDLIDTHARGLPQRIEALLRLAVEQGILVRKGTAWLQGPGSLDERTLGAGLASMAENRIQGLGTDALVLARWAAACAAPMGMQLLEGLSGLDEITFLLAAEELQAAGVMIQDGDRYVLELGMAEALYDRIPEDQRPAMHGAIARRLCLDDDPPLDRLYAIAQHYLKSDDHPFAVHYALQAGQAFARLYALKEAKALLEQGYERLPLAAAKAPIEAEYARLLGDIARQTADLDAAQSWYRQALTLADERHFPNLLNSVGKVHQMRNRFDEAALSYQGAIDAALTHGVEPERLRGLVSLSRLKLLKGDATEAAVIARAALDGARAAGSAPYLSESLGLLGYIEVSSNPEHMEDGLEALTESLAIRRALGDKLGLNDSYSLMGNAQLALGRYTEAWHSFEENLRLCRELGAAVDDEMTANLNLGLTGLERGRYRETLNYANAVLDGSQSPVLRALSLCLKALAAAYLGDACDPRSWMSEARSLSQEVKSPYIELMVLGYMIESSLFLGQISDTLDLGSAATELIAQGVHEGEARLTALLSEARIYQGQGDEAMGMLAGARSSAEHLKAQGFLARIAKAQAIAAGARNDHEAAFAFLDEAVTLATLAGMTALEAESLVLRAEFRLAAGDSAQARADALDALERASVVEFPALQANALYLVAQTSPEAEARARHKQACRMMRKAVEALPAALHDAFTTIGQRRHLLGQSDHGEEASPADDLIPIPHGMVSLQGLRAANEDRVWADLDRGIFLVADGIGGPGKGDLASELIVNCLETLLDKKPGEALDAVIAEAIALANRKIIVSFLADPALKGLGSTLTLGLVQGDRLRLWHIGDSRAYLVRKGKISCLTEDHTLARHLSKVGGVSESKDAHTLLRCVGKEAECVLDSHEMKLVAGDRLIFCTDGVHRLWESAELAELASGDDLEAIARTMAEGAIARGSTDNASVVMIGWQDGPEADAITDGLAILNDYSLSLEQVTSIEQLAPAVLDAALRLSGAERGYLILTEGEWEPYGMSGPCPELPQFSRSFVQWVIDHQEPLWLSNPDDRFAESESVRLHELRSVICLPLKTLGGMLGVLYLDHSDLDRALNPQSKALLEILYRSAAAHLGQNLATERLIERERRLDAMRSLGKDLSGCHDVEGVLRCVLSHCLAVCQAENGALFVGANHDLLAALDSSGRALEGYDYDAGILGQVLRDGRSQIRVEGGEATETTVVGVDLTTVLYVPIRSIDGTLGAVVLKADAVVAQLDERDLDLVMEMVGYAGPALEGARLYSELKESHEHLALTLDGLRRTSLAEPSEIPFEGDLGQHPLGEVIASHVRAGSTGWLRLSGEGLRGVVSMQNGQLVTCRSSFAGLEGEEALGEMLSWDCGAFRFEPGDVPAADPLPAHALIEALEMAPRWQKAKPRIPLDAMPIRLTDGGPDDYPYDQWLLVGQIDGETTVLDLARLTGMRLITVMEHLIELQTTCHLYLSKT